MNIHEEIKNLVEEAFDPLMALASKKANTDKLYVNLISLFEELAQEADSCKSDVKRAKDIAEEHTAMQEFFQNADGCEVNDIYSERGKERKITLTGTVEFEHLEFLTRLLSEKFTAYTKLPSVRY